ncbi:MAG TPA: peptidase S16 [Chloroflexi bacterium]|nr:peptidase S16 [Chloroflexota bacterium]
MKELPLFPLKTVLFPGMVLPLHIFEPRYRLMINQCIEKNSPFGVALIREGVEVGGPAVPHDVGTSAYVTEVHRFPDGRMHIRTVGYQRFRIYDLREDKPYLIGLVEDYPFEGEKSPEVRNVVEELRPVMEEYLTVLGKVTQGKIRLGNIPDDGMALALLIAILLSVPEDEKQQLLEASDLASMLRAEQTLLKRETRLLNYMLGQDRNEDRGSQLPFSSN